MKTRIASCLGIAVTVSSLSLIFSPTLLSQTPSNAPSNLSSSSAASQDSKTTDSTADRNSASTGNSAQQPGTLDKTSSKDTTNSLDKNPSNTPTDSDEKAATKNPTGTTSETSSQKTEAKSSEKTSDKDFLLKAAQGGMTEVQLGQLAQKKGSSADVKQFGSRMVTDHSKADSELKTLASQKGVTVPANLDSTHQAMVDHFKHLSGDSFDRAYVKMMVKDHRQDAAEFQQESTSAQDADVKAFAGKTLEVIKSHLSQIESIESKMQK